jgi:TolA-binding protein
MQSLKYIILIAIFGNQILSHAVHAQSFYRGGTEFNALRTVEISPDRKPSAVVIEFFHHGQINPDGRNVVVAAKTQLAPCRVLQLGPGDFCRLAFQPVKGQLEYDVLYGGDPPKEPVPAWTCQDGLLLETRHFKNCKLQNLDSVRSAFDSSGPIGADYVDTVFHGDNPFSLKREPFLSKYSGYINIPAAGKLGFMTASQDASFLLIDDKLVTSAPGRHGPWRLAAPNTRGDVQLSAGPHKFEYYHAAAGADGVMAAYWEINPPDNKPKVKVIPSSVFNAGRIAHLSASPPFLHATKLVPDFTINITGDVPLPGNDPPLIAVTFRDKSPKGLVNQGKAHWDFGDGQTASELDPEHIYLRPGVYIVKHSFRLSGRTSEITNRIEVDRPALDKKDKPHDIDDYLKTLDTYDLKTLDAASLRQLVMAYELKVSQLQDRLDNLKKELEEGPSDPNRKPDTEKDKIRINRNIDNFSALSRRYLTQMVDVGKAAFIPDSAAKDDYELIKLAQYIGPMVRCRLGDSPQALEIWQGAAEKIKIPALKAECQIAASDIMINDLLKAKDARPLLDQATAATGKGSAGSTAAALQRVWGDYYASTGDGKAARNAYAAAELVIGPRRNFIERTAWKGAHSRSAEEFIKSNQFDRAAEELQAWQREFPGEKTDGYLTLLFARYWAAREKFAQAVAQAEQLQTANPDSPYADQILLLAADCESRLGRKDRAAAILHSILKDYPGSPLLPTIQTELKKFSASGHQP